MENTNAICLICNKDMESYAHLFRKSKTYCDLYEITIKTCHPKCKIINDKMIKINKLKNELINAETELKWLMFSN